MGWQDAPVVSSAPSGKSSWKDAPIVDNEPDTSAGRYARVTTRAASPYAAATAFGAGIGSVVPGVGTAIGAAAGPAALGLTDLTAFGYNALARPFGLPRMTSGSEFIMGLFPESFEPQTPGQRILETTVQGATSGAGLGYGASKLASAAENALANQGRVLPRVARELAFKPGQQTLAGAASGATVGEAREAGIENPLALTALGFAGGLVPSVATGIAKLGARGVTNLIEPFTPGGKESIKARAYMESLSSNPALAEAAANLLDQGFTPEQVAANLKETGLAALLASSRQANTDIATLFSKRNLDRFAPVAAALAQAEEGLQRNALATEQQGAAQVNALSTQQQQALAAQRQQQAAALIALRQRRAQELAGVRTGAQQQQEQVGSALQQTLSQTEAEAAAARQAELSRQMGEAQNLQLQQQQVAGQVPETSPLAVGRTITERRAAEISRRQKEIVTPAYENAFRIAGDKPIDFLPVYDKASELASSVTSKFDPALTPDTREVMATFAPSEPGADVTTLPQVTLRQADEVIKAINRDRASLLKSSDPGARTAIRNLDALKATVETQIRSGVPEAAEAYTAARQTARTQVIEPFLKGWVANLQREGSTGVQVQAPESVVTKILAGQDEAERFLLALGNDQQAMEAVKAGIMDAYRNEVIKNGVIVPGAHSRFMSNAKYGRALEALDRGGMDIRQTLNEFGDRARALVEQGRSAKQQGKDSLTAIERDFAARQQQARDAAVAAKQQVRSGAITKSGDVKNRTAAEAENLRTTGSQQRAVISDQFRNAIVKAEEQYKPQADELRAAAAEAQKLLRRLESQGVRPEQSTANLARLSAGNPEMKQVIEDAKWLLNQEADYLREAQRGLSSGGGVQSLATEAVGKPPAPWGVKALYTSTINFVMARLSGKVDAKLAAEIALETMNSSKLADVLRAAPKLAERSGLSKAVNSKLSKPSLRVLGLQSAATGNMMAPNQQNQNALTEQR